MRAIWYEANGPAEQVLILGELPDPLPGPGEVRVALRASGINPSDVKARAGVRGPMPFARIIPHSDGAGVIDAVGTGVSAGRIGERVWLWNAAWQRPNGTCAELVCLPAAQAEQPEAPVADHEPAVHTAQLVELPGDHDPAEHAVQIVFAVAEQFAARREPAAHALEEQAVQGATPVADHVEPLMHGLSSHVRELVLHA